MIRTESQLQKELQQTKPFRSVYHEAVLTLLKTTDVLQRSLAWQLDPFGVTTQQYNVLRILRGAGPEGLPTLSIAERLVEETPGITRLLDRLERKGYVRRRRCETDRRQVFCYLSREGAALLSELDPIVQNAEGRVQTAISESEAETVVEILERVRFALASK